MERRLTQLERYSTKRFHRICNDDSTIPFVKDKDFCGAGGMVKTLKVTSSLQHWWRSGGFLVVIIKQNSLFVELTRRKRREHLKQIELIFIEGENEDPMKATVNPASKSESLFTNIELQDS